MAASDLLRGGNVDEALADLQTQVRASPADAKLRVFLFQLLAVQGAWERALTQLNVAGELDAQAQTMVQMYREAIRCEALREEVFAGKRTPLVFGEPEPWIALLLQAQKLTAEGQHVQAARLRDEALEAAPATAGVLKIRSAPTAPAEERAAEEQPFAWIADADSRLGPLLEAIVNGRYYWVPFHRIQRIEIEPPADLRDVVWMPVQFTWTNGGQTVGLVPTRYSGSHASSDPTVRLARKTEWQDVGGGAYVGLGQRMLATDEGEYALMDLREIQLAAAEPADG